MPSFEFNGRNSEDFYLIVEKDIAFSSPKRDVDFEKIKGQDGQVAISDNTLDNTTFKIPVVLNTPDGISVLEMANEISNWLKQDSLWHDLTFSDDPDYVYRAIFFEEYDVNQIVKWYGKATLNFTVKPYKFLSLGLREKVYKNGDTIGNTTVRNAKPKLTIKGTGNITIKIGDEILTLKGIDEGIIVDSLNQLATSLDGSRALWNKVTSWPLPAIRPGAQKISIEGNVTELKIMPRWEVIV